MRKTIIKLGDRFNSMPLDQLGFLDKNYILDQSSKFCYCLITNTNCSKCYLDVYDWNSKLESGVHPCVCFNISYDEYMYLRSIISMRYNDYRNMIADKIGFNLSEPMN